MRNMMRLSVLMANIIMAVLCLAIQLQQLLGPNGDDREPLFADEKESE